MSKRTTRFVSILALLLLAGAAHALVEEKAEPSAVLGNKAKADEQARMSAGQSLARAREMQEEAKNRVERLHKMPPNVLHAWVKGEISDADLVQTAREHPDFGMEKTASATTKTARATAFRWLRLGGVALLCLMLFIVYRRQKRA